MKEIIYGTINPAKVAQVKDVLEPLGYQVRSLADFDTHVTVEEDGETAEENARKKAITYAKAFGKKVLSMDVGLYFNDLPDDQQPGLHVRRLNGKERASDDEMLEYYMNLAKSMGDSIDAYWRYAFALAHPNGDCESFTRDTPRIFVSRQSDKVIEGYPLESMQIDPKSGKYVSEMSEEEIAAFWQDSIGIPLVEFMQNNY